MSWCLWSVWCLPSISYCMNWEHNNDSWSQKKKNTTLLDLWLHLLVTIYIAYEIKSTLFLKCTQGSLTKLFNELSTTSQGLLEWLSWRFVAMWLQWGTQMFHISISSIVQRCCHNYTYKTLCTVSVNMRVWGENPKCKSINEGVRV